MAENMSTTIETNLRKLRRLIAVPLDLGINKRLKLEEETDSVVSPTPLDGNAQPSWPNPENLSEATTFNMSPLEKEAETGSDTTEKAPFVKRHLPRRLLPKGCKPKQLFKKRASSLGKSQLVKRKCILQKCAEDTIVSFLWSEIRKLCSEECYGCEVDHPSQRQHDWCLMATDGGRIDRFLEGVLLTMDHDN